jgi:hypothetical protein
LGDRRVRFYAEKLVENPLCKKLLSRNLNLSHLALESFSDGTFRQNANRNTKTPKKAAKRDFIRFSKHEEPGKTKFTHLTLKVL